MEAPNYIIISLITVLFGIARYFFKDLHRKFLQSEKRNDLLHDKVVKLEGKVERLDEKMPSDIANLEKVMDLKFEQFNKQFEELTKAIRHAEKTMTSQAEAFVKLFNMNK
jgi:peptidoglycan hydrolase CwlO-like protein